MLSGSIRALCLIIILTGVSSFAGADTRTDSDKLIQFELPEGWDNWKGSKGHFAPKGVEKCVLNVGAEKWPKTLTVEFYAKNTVKNLETQNYKILKQQRSKKGKKTVWEVIAVRNHQGQAQRWHLTSTFVKGLKVDVNLLAAPTQFFRYEKAFKSVVASVKPK